MFKNYINFVIKSKDKKYLLEIMKGIWSGVEMTYTDSYEIKNSKWKWKFKLEKFTLNNDKNDNELESPYLYLSFSFKTRHSLEIEYLDYDKELPQLLLDEIIKNRADVPKFESSLLKVIQARSNPDYISFIDIKDNVEIIKRSKSVIQL